MPQFSKAGLKMLETCDERLQKLFKRVVERFDCTVICGHRGRKDQESAFDSGASKVHYPHGKHNSTPSKAVDVMPYPVDWSETAKNIERMALFAGFAIGIAAEMGIKVRWGHDWDGDKVPDIHGLVDRPHFELAD